MVARGIKLCYDGSEIHRRNDERMKISKKDALKGVSLRDFIPWKNIGIVWRNPAMPIFSVPGAAQLLR